MNRFAQLLQKQSWRCGGAVAIQDEQRTLNYAELAIATAELAEQLLLHAPDLRVASVLDNNIDAAMLELAVRRSAGVHAALPPYFSPEQLQHALTTMKPDLLVLPAQAAAPTANWTRIDAPALKQSAVWMHATAAASSSAFSSGCSVSFTSGTTGEPKGVVLDEKLLWTVATALADSAAPLAVRSHLCVLPLATLLETVGGLYAGLISGATVHLRSLRTLGYNGASGLDACTFHACIADTTPHSLILVPQLLDAIIGALEGGAAPLPSLRLLAVGGAATGAKLLERAERFGLPVFEGYGLTECASVVCVNRPTAHRSGSVGKPLPHVQVRVDAEGEIHVRGARPLGVIGADGIDALPNQEFATGDLGRLDEDGFLYVQGRRRNVFITSYGRNVSPEWVEGLLCDEACITQAWVHGEARAWNAAVIVVRDASVSEDQLDRAIARCNAKLPSYAQVGAYLRSNPGFHCIPGMTTTNGRLRREALLEHFQVAIANLLPNIRLQPIPSQPAGQPARPSPTLKEYASA